MANLKKETARISEIIEKLESFKEDLGDLKVYVVANDESGALVGTQIQFWGLSTSAVAGVEASTGEQWVMFFRSDEILQP